MISSFVTHNSKNHYTMGKKNLLIKPDSTWGKQSTLIQQQINLHIAKMASYFYLSW